MISTMQVGKRIAPAGACVLRASFIGSLLAVLAVLAGLAGCFYTDSVNTRPIAAISVETPLPSPKGEAAWRSSTRSRAR